MAPRPTRTAKTARDAQILLRAAGDPPSMLVNLFTFDPKELRKAVELNLIIKGLKIIVKSAKLPVIEAAIDAGVPKHWIICTSSKIDVAKKAKDLGVKIQKIVQKDDSRIEETRGLGPWGPSALHASVQSNDLVTVMRARELDIASYLRTGDLDAATKARALGIASYLRTGDLDAATKARALDIASYLVTGDLDAATKAKALDIASYLVTGDLDDATKAKALDIASYLETGDLDAATKAKQLDIASRLRTGDLDAATKARALDIASYLETNDLDAAQKAKQLGIFARVLTCKRAVFEAATQEGFPARLDDWKSYSKWRGYDTKLPGSATEHAALARDNPNVVPWDDMAAKLAATLRELGLGRVHTRRLRGTGTGVCLVMGMAGVKFRGRVHTFVSDIGENGAVVDDPVAQSIKSNHGVAAMSSGLMTSYETVHIGDAHGAHDWDLFHDRNTYAGTLLAKCFDPLFVDKVRAYIAYTAKSVGADVVVLMGAHFKPTGYTAGKSWDVLFPKNGKGPVYMCMPHVCMFWKDKTFDAKGKGCMPLRFVEAAGRVAAMTAHVK